MRIIMLNNIYKHYLEIIFKIRKEKRRRQYGKEIIYDDLWTQPGGRA